MGSVAGLEQYVCTLYETKDQLKRHIYSRADEAFAQGDKMRDSISGETELRLRQKQVREGFIHAIGGLPTASGSLEAKLTARHEADGYSVENLVLEPRPGHYATANLYLPRIREQQTGAVLFLAGHELEGKHSPYYHRVVLRLVQAGLIVLALDPLGQGERLSWPQNADPNRPPVWGTKEHQQLGAQCYMAGHSIARYFVHDAIRALDYLAARPEVDPQRLGVTGNSGGGTQTAMLMVCDDRLAAAAPGTFIMNRQQYMHAGGVQDAEQVWPGWSAEGFDHEDLLLAFAPKPLLVLAAQYDFFPIEATRQTVERCRRFWGMLGREGALQLEEDATTHRYTDRLASEAASFFSRTLNGKEWEAPAEELPALSTDSLICTATGQVRLDWPAPRSRSVLEENRELAARFRQERAARDPAEALQQAREWLANRVVAPRQTCSLNPRRVPLGETEGLLADNLLWWSQPGIMNSGYLFRSAATSANAAGTPLPLTVAVWQGGTSRLSPHWQWLTETCRHGGSVLVLNVSGEGPDEPYPLYGKPSRRFFGILHKLADELLWLGDSLAALRIHDVLRSLALADWLGAPGERVTFYAPDLYAFYVRLAAVLEERVVPETSVGSFAGIEEWVAAPEYDEEDAMSIVMPGVLEVLDLAELEQWLSATATRRD
ncbi:alpha/beta hydrolase family protein [Paenibacillus mesotrionivorans]|uniref:Alpha/beta hydrolase family protein n=1 Tax=Paenibacillus mesotrionivorans TaxID=3160968 RepID=A0ACC7NSX7_9BACL